MSQINQAIYEVQKTLFQEIGKVIVGQEVMLRGILTGLLSKGHILIEGLPGLAKTLSVSALAQAVSLKFQRVQFTPDLLPTDIIGTMVFNAATQEFTPKKGPIFTNILLADEINRAPAKVQSALLEAMEERQVTIGDTSYPLPDPFLVLATQNPIEQEGTYPLPEAQKDRFLFKVLVDYPSAVNEMEILNRMSQSQKPTVRPVWSIESLRTVQNHIQSIYLDEKIKKYIIELVMATRKPKEYGLPELEDLIEVGVSPRATVNFAPASRVQAFFQGRDYVSADDVKTVAYPLLRHRLILSYEAQAENITEDKVIRTLLQGIEVPGN
ncbi:MAG: MoxR family ATPase [Bdellovibrionales bacterium]|nr:MoxR family ATPase [Bdellovibrionales bacterium]